MQTFSLMKRNCESKETKVKTDCQNLTKVQEIQKKTCLIHQIGDQIVCCLWRLYFYLCTTATAEN